MNRTVAIVISITLIGLLLRFYNLSRIPNSVSADEASFAYNAYSVLHTGKDEFGRSFPLYFQSFDDYKNPVLVYTLVPFVALFGLSSWAIRLVSVISGTLVIPIFYLISNKLLHKPRLSLVICLFAGISPWLIQYSRVGIDVELALFFALSGVWLYLVAAKRPILYIAASFMFGLSSYTYHSSRLWVIAFGFVLLLAFRPRSKYAFAGIGLLLIFFVPYILLLKNSQIALRPYAISVFSNQEEINQGSQLLLEDIQDHQPLARLFHNRRLVTFDQAINGYLQILSPQLLFAQSKYNQISSTRLFFLWQLPLMLIGLFYLARFKKVALMILLWVLIGFIPGGLTKLPVFDRRVLLNSFPLIFIAGCGWYFLYEKLNPYPWLKKLALWIATATLAFSLLFYLHNYFNHGKDEVVFLWGNGMKELVSATNKLQEKYQVVYVSRIFDQTPTYFLYYLQYSPQKYLAQGGTISGGYLDERNHFDKYRFKFIKQVDMDPQALYVWATDESQPCLDVIQTTYMTNQRPYGHIGEYNPQKLGCQAWLQNN